MKPNKEPLAVGQEVKYYDVLIATVKPVQSTVTEIAEDGIPSCDEPMCRLKDKRGYVLQSHCFPLEWAPS